MRSVVAHATEETFFTRSHVRALQERGYLIKIVQQVVDALSPVQDDLRQQLKSAEGQLHTAGQQVAALTKEVAQLKAQLGQQESQDALFKKVRAAAVGWAKASLNFEERQYDRTSGMWVGRTYGPKIDENALWPVHAPSSDPGGAGKYLLVELTLFTFYSQAGQADKFVVRVNRETLIVEGARGRWQYRDHVFGGGVD